MVINLCINDKKQYGKAEKVKSPIDIISRDVNKYGEYGER
jgi:hypothetical protein